jgi:hypothetical protein
MRVYIVYASIAYSVQVSPTDSVHHVLTVWTRSMDLDLSTLYFTYLDKEIELHHEHSFQSFGLIENGVLCAKHTQQHESQACTDERHQQSQLHTQEQPQILSQGGHYEELRHEADGHAQPRKRSRTPKCEPVVTEEPIPMGTSKFGRSIFSPPRFYSSLKARNFWDV